jgi:phospholipase/carboxylesterase
LELIEELISQGIPSANIFLFGFSQGCLMALDVGLRTPHILGGICGVSGYMHAADQYPEAFSAATLKQEFLLTHGTKDPVVPYSNSKVQYQNLKQLGVTLNFLTYDKDHTLLPQEIRDIAGWLRLRISKLG